LHYWLPVIQPKENIRFKDEIQFLKNKETWFVLLVTAIGFGGLFTWFSYITPLMTEISGVKESNMAYVMALAGGGMVVGNLLGGYLTDQIGAPKTAFLMLLLMSLSLLTVFFFSSHTEISVAFAFICGGLSMSVGPPVNMMIMKAAPGSEMMAAAFMQAAFNIANSAGAYFGGLPLKHGLGYNYPSLVGVAMTCLGLIICAGYIYRYTDVFRKV
jgi:DHA1 family arabinose polymer transporter-like MFS transporter